VQERYTKLVDLLEKRISQLESVVNTAGQKKEEKKEEKEGEKKDEKADAEKKDGDADSKAADTKDDAAKSQVRLEQGTPGRLPGAKQFCVSIDRPLRPRLAGVEKGKRLLQGRGGGRNFLEEGHPQRSRLHLPQGAV